jgi:hypothetical protein
VSAQRFIDDWGKDKGVFIGGERGVAKALDDTLTNKA